MEVIKSFFNEFGYSFIMMVIISAVTAFTLEISVKSVFSDLIEKYKGNDKTVNRLKVAKAACIQLYVWTFIIKGLSIITECMPLPGNKACFLVWLGVMYVLQYLFSCIGLKGLFSFASKRLEKAEAKAEKKAQEQALKPTLVPIEGRSDLFNLRGADGSLLMDEFGRAIIVDAKGRRK